MLVIVTLKTTDKSGDQIVKRINTPFPSTTTPQGMYQVVDIDDNFYKFPISNISHIEERP